MMASPVAGAQTSSGGSGKLTTVIITIDPDEQGNIPDDEATVEFQYNPKDITYSRKIPAAKQK